MAVHYMHSQKILHRYVQLSLSRTMFKYSWVIFKRWNYIFNQWNFCFANFCRDLKPQNVFMNKSGTTCKLGDFGISKMMEATVDLASTCVGTPCYLAPEMCQDIPYSSKADVWVTHNSLAPDEPIFCIKSFDLGLLYSIFRRLVVSCMKCVRCVQLLKLTT